MSGATLNTTHRVPRLPYDKYQYEEEDDDEDGGGGGGGGGRPGRRRKVGGDDAPAAAPSATWATCPSGPSRAEAQLLNIGGGAASHSNIHRKNQQRRDDDDDDDDASSSQAPPASAPGGGGRGTAAAAVPSRPDLHTRWAERLERDEEERHSRRMQSLRASVDCLRRKKTTLEARMRSALADVELEEAALTSAVTEHVAAAVTRVEALAWECRAEFDRAAAVLDQRSAWGEREIFSTTHNAQRTTLTMHTTNHRVHHTTVIRNFINSSSRLHLFLSQHRHQNV